VECYGWNYCPTKVKIDWHYKLAKLQFTVIQVGPLSLFIVLRIFYYNTIQEDTEKFTDISNIHEQILNRLIISVKKFGMSSLVVDKNGLDSGI
jgi:hypothetical protein